MLESSELQGERFAAENLEGRRAITTGGILSRIGYAVWLGGGFCEDLGRQSLVAMIGK